MTFNGLDDEERDGRVNEYKRSLLSFKMSEYTFIQRMAALGYNATDIEQEIDDVKRQREILQKKSRDVLGE